MNNMKSLNILIAEDNQDHAELMIDTLQEFNIGNHLVHVTDGEQALHYLHKQGDYKDCDWAKPDLILLDIKMPKLDGIATLELIKSTSQFKSIPVIIVSTSQAEPDVRRCFEMGASSFITKPLRFDDFTKKIKELNLYWVLTSELPV